MTLYRPKGSCILMNRAKFNAVSSGNWKLCSFFIKSDTRLPKMCTTLHFAGPPDVIMNSKANPDMLFFM